jgi:hypothetical protein
MNQQQRKYLLETVESQYKTERRELNGRKPQAPSLNNYLIAAILDGSFVMHSGDEVREAVRKRVRDLGKGEALLHTNSRFRSGCDDEEEEVVSFPAKLLFDEPPGYVEANNEHQRLLSAWQAESSALESAFAAMKLKVQLGSDKALSALVDQADSLCSMSLTASSKRLLITEGKTHDT